MNFSGVLKDFTGRCSSTLNGVGNRDGYEFLIFIRLLFEDLTLRAAETEPHWQGGKHVTISWELVLFLFEAGPPCDPYRCCHSQPLSHPSFGV